MYSSIYDLRMEIANVDYVSPSFFQCHKHCTKSIRRSVLLKPKTGKPRLDLRHTISMALSSSGDIFNTALNSFRNASLSPVIFFTMIVCFVPPSRTLEYTGKNPMAFLGLFFVLRIPKGIERFRSSMMLRWGAP